METTNKPTELADSINKPQENSRTCTDGTHFGTRKLSVSNLINDVYIGKLLEMFFIRLSVGVSESQS